MTRPFKHPKTGIYWIRKRVPKALQPFVGKSEEKLSLKTRDVHEAKKFASRVLSELDERWAALLKGAESLSEREAHGFAEEVFHAFIREHAENPSLQTGWDPDLGDSLWDQLSPDEIDWTAPDHFVVQFVRTKPFECAAMIAQCERVADRLLSRKGLRVDDRSRDNLIRATASAFQRASLELRDRAKSPYARLPSLTTPQSSAVRVRHNGPRNEGAVTLDELYEGWAKESRAALRTKYAWKNVIRHLSKHLGHYRAGDITQNNLVAWKDSLLDDELSPKTIKDGKLAPVRAILQWGVKNAKLASNPATKVVIGIKQKPGTGKRAYSDEEAKLGLKAAIEQPVSTLKWIPWLCATSGARLSEISQLRRADIVERGGVWCLQITPEAGSIKTLSSERDVPLHAALLDLGFLKFVESVASGPLFAEIAPDRFNNRGGNTSKLIEKWVRSLGITDVRISPSHAWRHRLKTLLRRYRVDPSTQDAIMGHSQGTTAGSYGDHEIAVFKRELDKIPCSEFTKVE